MTFLRSFEWFDLTARDHHRRMLLRPPFPGMDPYLEHPAHWPGVHNGLIAALQLSLAPQLRPRYYVAMEERLYITEPHQRVFVGRPDLAVIGRPTEETGPKASSTRLRPSASTTCSSASSPATTASWRPLGLQAAWVPFATTRLAAAVKTPPPNASGRENVSSVAAMAVAGAIAAKASARAAASPLRRSWEALSRGRTRRGKLAVATMNSYGRSDP